MTTPTTTTTIWVHYSGILDVHKVGCQAVKKSELHNVDELPFSSTEEDIVDSVYGPKHGSFYVDSGCASAAEYIEACGGGLVRVHSCAKAQGFKLRRAAAVEVK